MKYSARSTTGFQKQKEGIVEADFDVENVGGGSGDTIEVQTWRGGGKVGEQTLWRRAQILEVQERTSIKCTS